MSRSLIRVTSKFSQLLSDNDQSTVTITVFTLLIFSCVPLKLCCAEAFSVHTGNSRTINHVAKISSELLCIACVQLRT